MSDQTGNTLYTGYTESKKTIEEIIRRNARMWGKCPDKAVEEYRKNKGVQS